MVVVWLVFLWGWLAVWFVWVVQLLLVFDYALVVVFDDTVYWVRFDQLECYLLVVAVMFNEEFGVLLYLGVNGWSFRGWIWEVIDSGHAFVSVDFCG